MATQVLDSTALEQLAGSVKGTVLTPGRDGYDEARTVFNAMVDNRPAAIVKCKDPHDVIAAIDLARARAAEGSIGSGGQGVTGSKISHEGIVIDLSEMKRIAVDSEARTVRAQAGVTWGELDATTQEHGLAVTGGRAPRAGAGRTPPRRPRPQGGGGGGGVEGCGGFSRTTFFWGGFCLPPTAASC